MSENTENGNERNQDTFQRLADVSLRTSATALAIIFAYSFAVGKDVSTEFKYVILGIGFMLLFSIICGVASLYGQKEGEMRFIKVFSVFATLLMVFGMVLAFLLLVSVLFSP